MSGPWSAEQASTALDRKRPGESLETALRRIFPDGLALPAKPPPNARQASYGREKPRAPLRERHPLDSHGCPGLACCGWLILRGVQSHHPRCIVCDFERHPAGVVRIRFETAWKKGSVCAPCLHWARWYAGAAPGECHVEPLVPRRVRSRLKETA